MHSKFLVLPLLLATLLGALPLLAAADATTPPRALKLVDRKAVEFVESNASADEKALLAFLAANKIEDKKPFAQVLRKNIVALQKVLADGIALESPLFWTYYDEINGTSTAPALEKPAQISGDKLKTYLSNRSEIAYAGALAERYIQKKNELLQASKTDPNNPSKITDQKQARLAQGAEQIAQNLLLKQAIALELLAKDGEPVPGTYPDKRLSEVERAASNRAKNTPLDLGYPPNTKSPLARASNPTGGLRTLFGSRMITPFTVSTGVPDSAPVTNTATPTAGTIKSTASDLRTYLEFGWGSFWTTSSERKIFYPGSDFSSDELSHGIFFLRPSDHFWRGWDIDTRMSVLLNPASKTDSFKDVGTITGAGDINMEVTVDRLLLVGAREDIAWSVALGTRFGGSSSRSEGNIHRESFVGLHANFSSVSGSVNQTRTSLFRFGFGTANVDTLSFVNGNNRTLVKMLGTTPEYTRRWVPALTAEIWYPIPTLGTLRLGSRFYPRNELSSWSIDAAYTIDLVPIFKGLFATGENTSASPDNPSGSTK